MVCRFDPPLINDFVWHFDFFLGCSAPIGNRNEKGNGNGKQDGVKLQALATVASPFNPQMLPKNEKRFFQGYYMRLVDHAKRTTVAVVLGSFRRSRRGKMGAPLDQFDEHYVCVMVNGRTFHHFVDAGDAQYVRMVDIEEPDEWKPSFQWSAPSVGVFAVDGDEGKVELSLPGVDLKMRFTRRVPWGKGPQDGPEGWLRQTPFLPCHYFVYSMASRSTYAVRLRSGPPGPQPYPAFQV
eukprot:scaffold447_cov307-Pinguiococcus_pyrenoidosus.AAC.46